MAPAVIEGALGGMVWSSSPATAFISLVIFAILCVTLLAVCTRCRRNSDNAYDVSGAQVSGETGVANGTATTNQGGDTGSVAYTEWRDHKAMPASTLERSMTSTN